jgi:hypothetical protein
MSQKYIARKEKVWTRDLNKILNSQNNRLSSLLLTTPWPKVNETKALEDDLFTEELNQLLQEFYIEIPAYYTVASQPVIKRWAKTTIRQYRSILPSWYQVWFDLPTDNAVKFIQEFVRINANPEAGWMATTTETKVRKLIADWIAEGKTYREIWREIQEERPAVFARTRADLIAQTEVWKAFWFWEYEPNLTLQDNWFVLEKRWHTSRDSKVRASHMQNADDGWILLNEVFSGTGEDYAPSSEARCRCFWETRIIWTKNVDQYFLFPKYIDKYINKLKIRVLHINI